MQVAPETLRLVDSLVDQGLVTDPRTPKGRLLAKAAKLFREKGYERTTVRDLASAVGIQSGSIFHHFKSKEEILMAVMREVIIYNTNRMQQLLEEAVTPRDKVLALIFCELEAINGMTGNAMSVLVYEWRSLKPDNQAEILKLRDRYEQLWLNALSEAKSAGQVEADVFVLRRFLTGALSWTTTWFDPKGDMSLKALAEQALTLAVKSS
ncbi:MAG: TetR family transcriptional regulator [Oleiphilus sp.]|nr:MAG: TetR family transcriptional regulator [Oleiphilus sp.]